MLKQAWLIALKDLRIFVGDRFAVFMAVVFPLLFVFLFSLIYRPSGTEDKALELVVVTEEGQMGLSHQIISGLTGLEPVTVREMGYQEALDAVNSGEIGGFLAFPADFTEGALTGAGASLKVVANPESTGTRMALDGLARSVSTQVGAVQVAVRSAIALLEKQQMASPGTGTFDPDRMQQALSMLMSGTGGVGGAPGVEFSVEQVGAIREPAPGNWLLPGYLVMFVFFASALAAEGIVAERETQTLERLMASGARRPSLLGGKFLCSLLRGLAQVAILWTAGVALFGVSMGASPVAVAAISVLTVLMASAFGVMLAALVKTRRAAGAAAVTASIALAPIGGCWWPLFITPAWMQFLAHFTPHGWATTGFNKLLVFGAQFGDVLPEMIALLGFAIAFAVIGVWRFRTQSA